MTGRALLPYVLAAALVGCGAQESAPAPRLAAEVKQYRSDIAKRTVALTVANRSDGGVLVRTEESWTGAQLEADPATAIKVLAPGLDFWLADLKAAAEALPAQK